MASVAPSVTMARPAMLSVPLAKERRSRPFQLFLCIALPLLWSGLPLSLIGAPRAIGIHASSSIILACLLVYLVQLMAGRQRIDVWVVTPLLLLAAMLFATIVSATFYFNNPLASWAGALSNYSPLLLIFALRALDVRLSELINGLLIVALIAAVLVAIDQFVQLSVLSDYVANSGFSSQNRRVLLLKNEVAFGLLIAMSRLLRAKTAGDVLLYGAATAVIAFDLVVATESRLVLGTVLLAAAAFTVFALPVGRKIVVIVTGVLVLGFAGQFVFAKYIDRLTKTQDYAANDISVRWRLISVQHYRNYFDQSGWVGFGIMSASPDADNILTYSLYKAAPVYGGNPKWGVYLADISLFGALFQFGIPGFLAVLFMALYGAGRMIAASRVPRAPYAADVASIGFVLLFFTVNPWPLNIFGLSPWLMSGGMVWTVAARWSQVRRRYLAAQPMMADVPSPSRVIAPQRSGAAIPAA